MSDPTLRDKLVQLHTELSTIHTVDDDTRALLREVQQDVQTLLRAPAAPEAGVVARWQAAIRQFEVSHPTLTHTLEHALNTLSNMGV
jgi:hypothetical protein